MMGGGGVEEGRYVSGRGSGRSVIVTKVLNTYGSLIKSVTNRCKDTV